MYSNTENLLADDENGLRYASGYVGMKLLREFRTDRSSKVSQYRECLSKMSKDDDDSSFCAYTKAWIDTINRGGLFDVNDILFKSIEVKTRQVLPQHLAGSTHATPSKKEELVKLIARDEIIQGNWREVGEDIVDEDDFNFLLLKIINLWVT